MTTTQTIPSITLNNGVTIPQLDFGVFQVPDDETTAAVTADCDSLGGDRGGGLIWTHLADRRCVVTV